LGVLASLLEQVGEESRLLWVVNEAPIGIPEIRQLLEARRIPWMIMDPDRDAGFPPSGTVGLILNERNLGYGAGNNVALRYLHARGIPFAWVLNNDVQVIEGSSAALAEVAQAQPDVGAWGTALQSDGHRILGHRFSTRTFAAEPSCALVDPDDPTAFLSGCSLFLRLEATAQVGFLPEAYFLYYEDIAFSLRLKQQGWRLGMIPSVVVRHDGSLTSGRRSPLVEYYNKRNRWFFMQEFFPDRLQTCHWDLFRSLQKYAFRGRWMRLRMEWAAYRDFRAGRTGPRPMD
jgi:GT2 family glycosyltransferase